MLNHESLTKSNILMQPDSRMFADHDNYESKHISTTFNILRTKKYKHIFVVSIGLIQSDFVVQHFAISLFHRFVDALTEKSVRIYYFSGLVNLFFDELQFGMKFIGRTIQLVYAIPQAKHFPQPCRANPMIKLSRH